MATMRRKATFSLHEDTLAALDEAVKRGDATSKNELVEQALVRQVRELERRAERSAWEDAMHDPLFLRDLEQLEDAFHSAPVGGSRTTARRSVRGLPCPVEARRG